MSAFFLSLYFPNLSACFYVFGSAARRSERSRWTRCSIKWAKFSTRLVLGIWQSSESVSPCCWRFVFTDCAYRYRGNGRGRESGVLKEVDGGGAGSGGGLAYTRYFLFFPRKVCFFCSVMFFGFECFRPVMLGLWYALNPLRSPKETYWCLAMTMATKASHCATRGWYKSVSGVLT